MKTEHKKYLIIGAGPGGLQLGYFLQKAGLEYLILEKNGVPGSFFCRQPVHRKLISINKKYNYFTEDEFNWRHDWNSLLSSDPALRLTNYTDELFPTADTLLTYLADFAAKCRLDIAYHTEVKRVSKADGQFLLKTVQGTTYTCEVLIVATGAVAGVVPDDIEGIEHTTPYSGQSTDLDFYRNKRVGILGGGNSAFETADYLSGAAAYVHVLTKHPLKMAWDTHFVGDLRAVNNNVLDMYQLKSLHAVLNPRIKKIEKLPNNVLKTHHAYDYPRSSPPGTLELTREYDVIINCTGFNWVNLNLFDKTCKPAFKGKRKYPLLNEGWESQNVPHLYFAGGAMQAIDRKSASGFIHGFRYNVRTLAHLLQHRYEQAPLATRSRVKFERSNFLDDMYARLSTTAALFQLYGFLGDFLIFSKNRSPRLLSWAPPTPTIRPARLSCIPSFAISTVARCANSILVTPSWRGGTGRIPTAARSCLTITPFRNGWKRPWAWILACPNPPNRAATAPGRRQKSLRGARKTCSAFRWPNPAMIRRLSIAQAVSMPASPWSITQRERVDRPRRHGDGIHRGEEDGRLAGAVCA
jgi:thioredoxin reductase